MKPQTMGILELFDLVTIALILMLGNYVNPVFYVGFVPFGTYKLIKIIFLLTE